MLLTNKEVSNFDFPGSTVVEGCGNSSLEALFDKQPLERFVPGAAIFFQGDPARHIFQVTEGVVRLVRILADGRRVITGFLFAGDIVGISENRRFLGGAEAVTAVKLKRIGRKALEEAVNTSSELRPQLFVRVCNEMAAAQAQMVLLSCKTAEERVATFLHSMFRRAGSRGYVPAIIELPMSRQDIADFLGLTIETVSRNLTKLCAKGVLSHVERFTLRVVKPRMLEELAGLSDDEEEVLSAIGHRH